MLHFIHYTLRVEKMISNGSHNNANIPYNSHPRSVPLPVYPLHSIPVYTVLCVLRRMKGQLGLEAMLEYMDRYVSAIEAHNPELKQAVTKAIAMMKVEKMYRQAMS